MAIINFGGTKETVITRKEFSLAKARQVLNPAGLHQVIKGFFLKPGGLGLGVLFLKLLEPLVNEVLFLFNKKDGIRLRVSLQGILRLLEFALEARQLGRKPIRGFHGLVPFHLQILVDISGS